jgi:hypothetical protein
VTSLPYLFSYSFNKVFYVDRQTLASDQYVYGLDVPTGQRYSDKLNEIVFHMTNRIVNGCECVDDVSLWSPVTFADVYSYLKETPGQFTRETLKVHK